MKINKITEKCSDNEHCDYNDFKRGRYFHGMLMTDRDFTEEQTYHIEKRRLHNRMLHGWGVVCGLRMTSKDNKSIIINTGLALDCNGNEIFVCQQYMLNVIDIIKKRTTSKADDKGCNDTKKPEDIKWYVTISYLEEKSDKGLVHATSTSECIEKVCDYSRIQEGYCLKLCTENCCPPAPEKGTGICDDYKNEKIDKEKLRQSFCEKLLLECPGECCNNPKVVLGSFTLKDAETIDKIDNWDCRKFVITFGLLQHWINILPGVQIPFEKIADYSFPGDACKDADKALETFCPDIVEALKGSPGKEAPSVAVEQRTQMEQPKQTKKEKSETGVKGAKGKAKGA
jgi:hypothetical protein